MVGALTVFKIWLNLNDAIRVCTYMRQDSESKRPDPNYLQSSGLAPGLPIMAFAFEPSAWPPVENYKRSSKGRVYTRCFIRPHIV